MNKSQEYLQERSKFFYTAFGNLYVRSSYSYNVQLYTIFEVSERNTLKITIALICIQGWIISKGIEDISITHNNDNTITIALTKKQ